MSETNDTANKSPKYKVKYDLIEATAWEVEGQNGNFLSINVSRSYKNKDEEWKTTKTFRTSDLPTLALVVNDLYKKIKSDKE